MTALADAWAVLRDPARRAAYDRRLSTGDGIDYSGSPFAAAGLVATDDATTEFEPTPAERVMRAAPWIVAVAVLVVIFVFTAYALQRPSPPVPAVPANVDGRLAVGSCVVAPPGQPLREVSCDGSHDGVVANFVPFTTPCPGGTESGVTTGGTLRICFRPATAGTVR